MTDTSAQERARAVIAQGAAYASAWTLMAIREMELKAVSGDAVADFIADALTEAKRQGAEAGWMAASAAIGYEARKESAKADLASWWWAAAVWLEQNQDDHHLQRALSPQAIAHARGEMPARYECGHRHNSFEDALNCLALRKKIGTRAPVRDGDG